MERDEWEERRKELEALSLGYFMEGFHCAEAISKTIMGAFGRAGEGELARLAAGFGGGMGATREEACGTLSGGIMALGCLLGRETPGEGWEGLKGTVAEFRRRFVAEVGASRCSAILDGMGEQENMMKCKEMTAKVTGMLADILVSQGMRPSPS